MPNERWVNVWVGQDKRDVLLRITVMGFTAVDEARAALVAFLREEGPDGEGGTVEHVAEEKDGIDVITDRCGFFIDDVLIEQAIKNGTAEG